MKLKIAAAVAALMSLPGAASAQNESGVFAVSDDFGLETQMEPLDGWWCGATGVTIVQASGNPINGGYAQTYGNIDGTWHLKTYTGFSATGRCVKLSAFPGGSVFTELGQIGTSDFGIAKLAISVNPNIGPGNSLCFAQTIWGEETLSGTHATGGGVVLVRPPSQPAFWEEWTSNLGLGWTDNYVDAACVPGDGQADWSGLLGRRVLRGC